MKDVFEFLTKLKANNNRNWFQQNRSAYEKSLEKVIEVADELLSEMQAHDQIETPNGRKSLKRIYRDVRFSKDKTPYKIHWGGGFKRATSELRGGYYFHLEPGNSYLIGGFWRPNKEDLKLVRDHLTQDDLLFRNVLNSDLLKREFGKLYGESLKTSPKGYDPNNPANDLLKFKQFLLKHTLSDQEVLSANFPQKASKIFKNIRPYFDIMSDFLTTDLNGMKF